MNNYYIYVYFDPTRDLEAFYVGKGHGKRSHGHLTRTDQHPFTQRLQKMAKQGVIPIIERYEDLTEEAAFSLEVALIAEIGRKQNGTGPLLNLTDGGEGPSGWIPTEVTRHRMAESRKGKKLPSSTKKKISDSLQNAYTEESRSKISAANKGKAKSPEHKAKIAETMRKRRQEKKW